MVCWAMYSSGSAVYQFPWQALLLSIGVYVALPLVAGYCSRQWIMRTKGEQWFRERFLHFSHAGHY